MAATFFQAPELELEKDEAARLASALAEVNKHYRIPVVREDHAAIFALVITALMIYGKRFSLISSRVKRGHNGGPPLNDKPAPAPSPAPSFAGHVPPTVDANKVVRPESWFPAAPGVN